MIKKKFWLLKILIDFNFLENKDKKKNFWIFVVGGVLYCVYLGISGDSIYVIFYNVDGLVLSLIIF